MTALRKLKKKPKKQKNTHLQKSATAAIKKVHWAKESKSIFDIEGKPILENSKQETPPGPLQQKPGANCIFSLKP